MAVANQKIVTVNKEPCDNKGNLYVKINIEAMNAAMNKLTPAQLKVWLYFAKNQKGYKFELSSVAVQSFCNISEKTYREAIKTLIEKRYLVRRATNNYYDFYEVPQPVEVIADGTMIECHTTTEI